LVACSAESAAAGKIMKHNLVIAVSVLLAIAPLDGALSQGVAQATGPTVLPKRLRAPETIIERLDRDGDGKVSLGEFRQAPAHFAAIDANHDGFLTVDEFRAFRQHAAQRRQRRANKESAGGPGSGPGRTCTFAPAPPPSGSGYEIDVYSPDCMFKGTTLFADSNKQKTHTRIVEVDYAGRIVWSVTPSDLVSVPKGRQVMDVDRLPSGNTLFNIKDYGAFEVTPDRKLVWRHYDNGISHDVDRLPNGDTIFVRGWVKKGEDLVREVNPAGKVVWSWNGLAQYDRPPYTEMDDEGWMHTNAVTRLANGNTMLSLRNIDRTVEVDPAGNVVREVLFGRGIPAEARATAKEISGASAVFRPHDPEYEPNGDIVVASPGTNRIVELTRNGALVRMIARWPRKSDYYGVRDANRLPNGNTLVVGNYRIFEVSPDGQVVWSLHHKGVAPTGHALSSRDNSAGTNFYKAQRIAPDGTAYGH
jgi:hypothetical protein